MVVLCTSAHAGVTTFRISERTSLRNCVVRVIKLDTWLPFPPDFAAERSMERSAERSWSGAAIAFAIKSFFCRSGALPLRPPDSTWEVFFIIKLAGAEGFEPPSSVLETDSLTVELTPLFYQPLAV